MVVAEEVEEERERNVDVDARELLSLFFFLLEASPLVRTAEFRRTELTAR